ncbi:MAG: hypothetical protein ACFFBD_01920 [Candidatus Hodarchaeota archaeon]
MVVDELLTKATHPLLKDLLESYKQETSISEIFAMTGSFLCSSFGGSQERADFVGKVLQSFFFASSVHDDAVDVYDKKKQDYPIPLRIILGDMFFVSLAKYLAFATEDISLPDAQRAIEKLVGFLRTIGKYQVLERKDKIRTEVEAFSHTLYLGAIQGRMAAEFGAVLGKTAQEEDITQIGDVCEKFFLILTIQDDLADLIDDLANGVFTWPVCWLFERKDEFLTHQKLSKEDVNLLTSGINQRKILDAQAVYLMLKKTGTFDMVKQKVKITQKEALELLNHLAERRKEQGAMKWFILENAFQFLPGAIERTLGELEKKLSL